MSCDAGRRCGSDPALLWLWCKLAATVPIGPLAWEPPYATGAVLEKAKRQKKKKRRKKKKPAEESTQGNALNVINMKLKQIPQENTESTRDNNKHCAF